MNTTASNLQEQVPSNVDVTQEKRLFIRLLPSHKVILQASSIWLVTRFILIILTYIVVFTAMSGTPTHVLSTQVLLQAWAKWDAGFFLALARYGYYSPIPTVYYPMYPLLIHVVAGLLRINILIAALIISNLGSLAAFIGLGILALQENETKLAAPNAVRVAASFPLAFFLAAPYSEGIFLALAVWTLVYMRRGAWYRTAACAFAAGWTRPTAVILILPLAWEYCRQHGWLTWAGKHWRVWRWQPQTLPQRLQRAWSLRTYLAVILQALIVVEAVPLAFALYALYCKVQFGSSWVFIQNEQIYWLHRPMFPWEALDVAWKVYTSQPIGSYNQMHSLVDLIPLAFFALLTLFTIRRTPFCFTLYMLGLLQLCITAPVMNGNYPFVLMSTGRFLVVAIPIFLLLGRWIERHQWLDMLLVSGGFMLQAIFTAIYLQGGWVA